MDALGQTPRRKREWRKKTWFRSPWGWTATRIEGNKELTKNEDGFERREYIAKVEKNHVHKQEKDWGCHGGRRKRVVAEKTKASQGHASEEAESAPVNEELKRYSFGWERGERKREI